jgi:hypothetical protein
MERVGFHGRNQCVGLMWVYGALIDLAFEGCSILSDLFAVHVGRVFMFLRLEHLISCIRNIRRNWSVYQVVSHAGCPLTAQQLMAECGAGRDRRARSAAAGAIVEALITRASVRAVVRDRRRGCGPSPSRRSESESTALILSRPCS